MEIVFCYYDNINYDARAQEELQALRQIGTVHFVSFASCPSDDFSDVHFVLTGKRSFAQFLLLADKTIRQLRPELVFLHDYFCAPLIRCAGKYTSAKIIYDMSELYIGREKTGTPLYVRAYDTLLRHWEYRYIRRADLTLAANEHRAYIARGYFGLSHTPVVFDNVHRITENFDEAVCREKYGKYFSDGAFVILYAGGLGYPDDRDAGCILNMMRELGKHYRLIVAGNKSEHNPVYDKAMERNAGTDNIHYVGRIPRSELRYLYSRSHVNIVTFALSTINNIFCASGKLYEGLFEGLPFVCGENPPLTKLCEQYGLGVPAREHDYLSAVKEIEKNRQKYVDNIHKFMNNADYDGRIDRLSHTILSGLSPDHNN